MAKIENILPSSGGSSQLIERTSQLINDGENGNSKYIEEVDIADIIESVTTTIIDELKPQYHYFENKTSVTVEHGLGKYPQVTVMEGTEEIIPHSIEHTPDMNAITVTFIPETTGLIIIQ